MPDIPLNFLNLNRSFNPNAQYSIGNIVAFADAAGTAPVDGTGGAPTVTATRTISSPLDGIASVLFTKDAANRQGEGMSADVVLQASDATKVFTFQFDYQITTGTYTGYQNPPSFSDLTAWVYDITNSVMYQVQGFQLDGAVSTTNQYTFQGTWQVPVGCLQARLIWFLGNTGASAFTAKFNNISFGRIPRVQGSIDTPWTGYTLTVLGSTRDPIYGSGASLVASWRRSGPDMFIEFNAVQLSATGASYGQGSYRFPLPTGYVADTARLSPNATDNTIVIVGNASAFTNGTPTGSYNGNMTLDSSTYMLMNISTDASSNQSVGHSWFAFNASTLKLGFQARIPILGWATNGTIGQDADTRIVSAKYAMGTSFGLGSNLTLSQQFDTKSWDTHGAATYGIGVTFTYYVPISGYYRIKNSFVANSTAWTTSTQVTGQALVGTSASVGSITFNRQFDASVTIAASDFGTCELNLKAGDPLNFTIASAGVTSSLSANTSYNIVEIERMSGPAQVQAPEIITARYSTNAGQSILNNTISIIDYEDKSYDDHGCVSTGASWKFTCPRAGKVRVNAEATLASNAGWGLGETAYLSVFKNAVEFGRGPYDSPATATLVVDLSVGDVVDVLAGDTIDIRIFQLSGGTIALDTTSVRNFVSINYVGGIA